MVVSVTNDPAYTAFFCANLLHRVKKQKGLNLLKPFTVAVTALGFKPKTF